MSKVNDSSLWQNDNAADGDVVDQTAWNQNMQVFKAAINDNQDQINQVVGSQTTQVVATGTAYPATPGTGEMFYRTDLKQMFLWDGTAWVADQTFSAFYAYSSVVQTFSTTNTDELITFGSTQFDTLSEYDTTNSKFVANEAGIYLFQVGVTMNNVTADMGYLLSLYGNGTRYAILEQGIAAAAGNLTANGGVFVKLQAGDAVEIYLSCGSTYSGGANSTAQYFTGARIQ